MISSGSSSPARVSASPSTSRPSASVLVISTVSPLRLFKMSPGRRALPSIAFSTAGISRCRCTGSFASITRLASASACAAPPISFFINSMPAGDFIDSPPVSKVTPLPTIAIFGWSALPHFSSIRRGAWARIAALPTPWIIGKCSSSVSPRVTFTSPPCFSDNLSTRVSILSGPISAAGVLTISRTIAVACACRTASSRCAIASLTSSTLGPCRSGSCL